MKKTIALMFLLVCLLGLISCGGNEPEQPDTPDTPVDQPDQPDEPVEPKHEHIACLECGKCTASDCDGKEEDKCSSLF